jgi:hypothetical protein
MVVINAKANARPTVEASKRPVTIRVAGSAKKTTTVSTISVGSRREKTARSRKPSLDMEKTANDLGGITANSPTIIAKSGKINLGSKAEMIEPKMKIRTTVVSENKERAKQRRR